MLSPGTQWKQKLKLRDEGEVLQWRKYLLRRASASRRVRDGLRETCKHDLLFYVNAFGFQYNPRKLGSEVGPFTTWPFQDKAFPMMVRAIDEQVNLVCQKSREMGLSWMFLFLEDWLCRFHDNKKVLTISRNAEAVESESSDCLFWKIDFIQSWLPEWLHEPERFRRRKMYFGYPNGSSITGEASTGRAGVGGRATMILVDEFSHIKEDWEVLHRTSDTSYCRMFNGTHLGLDTAFFKLCNDRAAFPDSSWKRLTVHWTEHPDKNRGLYRFNQGNNQIEPLDKSYFFPEEFDFVRSPEPVGGPCPGIRSPWYDRACGDKGSARAVAMDLDINPQGSVTQVFDPLISSRLKQEFSVPPFWSGDVEFNPLTGHPVEPVRLLRAEDGPLKLWLHLLGDKVRPSQYKCGVDLSTGRGATNSCGQFLDSRLCEKVASYTSARIKPDLFARIMVALCKLFGDEYQTGAELVWECPGPGLDFGDVVLKLGYRNIYWKPARGLAVTGPNMRAATPSEIPGWYQSQDGKRWIVDRYCRDLESRKYVTRDEEELKDTLSFKWSPDGRTVEHAGESSGDDPSGARVNHGDRTIAAALAWMLVIDRTWKVEDRAEDTGPPPGSLAWRRSLRENNDERDYEESA